MVTYYKGLLRGVADIRAKPGEPYKDLRMISARLCGVPARRKLNFRSGGGR